MNLPQHLDDELRRLVAQHQLEHCRDSVTSHIIRDHLLASLCNEDSAQETAQSLQEDLISQSDEQSIVRRVRSIVHQMFKKRW